MYRKRMVAGICRFKPATSRSPGQGRYKPDYFLTNKTTTMSNENLEFMHNALKYLGFGERTSLNHALEEHVLQGSPDFELETEASFDGESILTARLYYHRYKSQLNDRYYLNK